ncbi:MAG: (2Fe-2S) ferredoxin domain-containing protein [Deltaproteobacteria bacterium]|nr:(2Fe-2S) ferredoxin domain-containing protein [Deltaproteobacteria bacterium]
MAIPKHLILLCQSFRQGGGPKGVCHKQTDGFPQYLEEEIIARGLDCQVAVTGCLKRCDQGPVLVVMPQNWWFGGVDSEETLDAILDGLENGEPGPGRLAG